MNRFLFKSVISAEQLNFLGKDRIDYVIEKSN